VLKSRIWKSKIWSTASRSEPRRQRGLLEAQQAIDDQREQVRDGQLEVLLPLAVICACLPAAILIWRPRRQT
jgi:hypothetical protein